MASMNKEIIENVSKDVAARLAKGYETYGKDLHVEDALDYVQETIEEVYDALVYTQAQLLKVRKLKEDPELRKVLNASL